MRHHLVASRAVRRRVSMPLTTLQVAYEEVVFRAVFPLMLAAGFSGALPWEVGSATWTRGPWRGGSTSRGRFSS